MSAEQGSQTHHKLGEGRFIAVYPNGSRSDVDLGGLSSVQTTSRQHRLHLGDVTDDPNGKRKHMVVGYLRPADDVSS